MADLDQELARKGRKTALVIAGTAVFWILANLIGEHMGWSLRLRALFDLVALAGFIFAFAMIYQIWRLRQKNQR